MEIKVKKDRILPNNWKQCGYGADDWDNLNSGGTMKVEKVPSLIENYVDVIESTPKQEKKKKKIPNFQEKDLFLEKNQDWKNKKERKKER